MYQLANAVIEEGVVLGDNVIIGAVVLLVNSQNWRGYTALGKRKAFIMK